MGCFITFRCNLYCCRNKSQEICVNTLHNLGFSTCCLPLMSCIITLHIFFDDWFSQDTREISIILLSSLCHKGFSSTLSREKKKKTKTRGRIRKSFFSTMTTISARPFIKLSTFISVKLNTKNYFVWREQIHYHGKLRHKVTHFLWSSWAWFGRWQI